MTRGCVEDRSENPRGWPGEQGAVPQRQPGTERGGDAERGEARGETAAQRPRLVGEQLQRVLDRVAQLLQRGPVFGTGSEAGVDRLGQLAGQVRPQAAQRPGAGADRPRGRGRAGAPVRVLAAPALVEDEGERVDVGLGAGLAALGLLGRHVGEGADNVAGGGQRGTVGEAGDPEVHQLGARFALGHLHVLGLDVAVDDAARVGVVERLAEVGPDLADLAVGEAHRRGRGGPGCCPRPAR